MKILPQHFCTDTATIETRLGDVGRAVSLYQLFATFPVDEEADRTSYYERQAAYELLLLGDISKSKALLAKMVDSTQNRTEKSNSQAQSFGGADEFCQVLQALIYREDGEQARAMDTTRSIGDKYVSMFRDSRFSYEYKEAVPWSLEALICLDQHNTSKAQSLIKRAESEIRNKDKSEPILDILKGWLLLEEGRLDDCLKMTSTTLASEKQLDASIDGMNLKAALHLIRKNVFLQQNLTEQAAHENELYKRTHVSGRIFTPICYRPNP